jgi:hypothetical protein
VTWEAVVSVLAAPLAAIYMMSAHRSIRRMRAGDAEWRRRWRQLDRSRRRTIRQKMKRGQPVDRPEDAEVLVRAVAQTDHIMYAMTPMTVTSRLIVIAMLIGGIAAGVPFLIVCGVVGAGSTTLLDLLSRSQRRAYHKSAAATRRRHGLNRPAPHG